MIKMNSKTISISAKDFALLLINSFYFPCCRKYSNRYLASKIASVLQYKTNACIRQEVHTSR